MSKNSEAVSSKSLETVSNKTIKDRISEVLRNRDELKIELEKELAQKEKECADIRQLIADLDPASAKIVGSRPGKAVSKWVLENLKEHGASDFKALENSASLQALGFTSQQIRISLARLIKSGEIEKVGINYRIANAEKPSVYNVPVVAIQNPPRQSQFSPQQSVSTIAGGKLPMKPPGR